MATTKTAVCIARGTLFSYEEIRNISSLGDVLRQIRARLKSEGVSIDDARKEILKKYPITNNATQKTKRKTK